MGHGQRLATLCRTFTRHPIHLLDNALNTNVTLPRGLNLFDPPPSLYCLVTRDFGVSH